MENREIDYDRLDNDINAALDRKVEGTLAAMFGPGDEADRTNINPADANEGELYIAAVGGHTEKLKKMVNKQLSIIYFYCKEAEFKGKAAGEVNCGLRCVLIDDEAEFYSTTSISAIRTIAARYKLHGGKQRWEPPLKVMVGIHGDVGGEYITLTAELDKAKILAAVKGGKSKAK